MKGGNNNEAVQILKLKLTHAQIQTDEKFKTLL